MSNFIKTFQDGQIGKNFGLTTGIRPLDRAINRTQRKTSIGIISAPKVGKTTLVDYAWVLSPYLEMVKREELDNIQWIYFSYEIDRVNKEYKYAAFFMYYDYDIFDFEYKSKRYLMSQDYLMGRLVHIEGGVEELVPVSAEHEKLLKMIYKNRIVPLFGEWDEHGSQTSEGKIKFIEERETPTDLNKWLVFYAKRNGKFITQSYNTLNDRGEMEEKQRVVGYDPYNPDKFTVIITDHVRKLEVEKGLTRKENIDKWLSYSTFLRNICNFTFIHVGHSNRDLANPDRLKYAGEWVFPTGDDAKDTGNMSEECTMLITLFNPNDEKYNLKKHFGVELAGYPNYRSIHLAESRYTECPVHIQVNMFGNVNIFRPLT